MADTIHTLAYKVIADTSQFTRGMTATRKEITEAKKVLRDIITPAERYEQQQRQVDAALRKGLISQEQATRAIHRYRDELHKATRDQRDFAEEARKGLAGAGRLARGALIGAGVAGVGAATFAGARAIGLAADAEQAQIAFEVMLRDADLAKSLLEDIRALGAATPFNNRELRDAGRSLIAYGGAADNVVNELRMLGDLASGLGIPLNELADIYGKARVQGRLFQEDINQLAGRGIPIYQELAKQFGVAEGEIRKLVERGQVGFGNLEAAVISLTAEGGMFGGMMERQSGTLAGLFSTLQDTFDELLLSVGKELVPVLKTVVDDTIKWIESLSEADIKAFAQDMGEAAKNAAELAKHLGTVSGYLLQFAVKNPASYYGGQVETLRLFGQEFRRGRGLDEQLADVTSRTLAPGAPGMADVEYRRTLETNPILPMARPMTAELTLGPAAAAISNAIKDGINAVGNTGGPLLEQLRQTANSGRTPFTDAITAWLSGQVDALRKLPETQQALGPGGAQRGTQAAFESELRAQRGLEVDAAKRERREALAHLREIATRLGAAPVVAMIDNLD